MAFMAFVEERLMRSAYADLVGKRIGI